MFEAAAQASFCTVELVKRNCGHSVNKVTVSRMDGWGFIPGRIIRNSSIYMQNDSMAVEPLCIRCWGGHGQSM